MMQNPIAQREFVGLLRSPLALIFQVLFIVLLGGLVFLRWPANGAVDMAAQQSQQVLRIFGYGILAALVLLCPILPPPPSSGNAATAPSCS